VTCSAIQRDSCKDSGVSENESRARSIDCVLKNLNIENKSKILGDSPSFDETLEGSCTQVKSDGS